MAVYIEYAFLQNFLFDGGLLCLALWASRTKLRVWRIVLSAVVGACFALIFPFLRLPKILSFLLKFSVGAFLCLLAFGRLKRKKEWGRYLFTTFLFFTFTFGFGGALTAFWGKLPQRNTLFWGILAFAVLTGVSLWLIGKIRQRKARFSWIYPCEITFGEKKICAQGFLDSGNGASKYGIPVCFLSTHLFYELWGEEIAFADGVKKEKGKGQGWDKIRISTLTGEKEMPLCIGELSVKIGGGKTKEVRQKKVYFAPSANMITREYDLLLNARIFED